MGCEIRIKRWICKLLVLSIQLILSFGNIGMEKMTELHKLKFLACKDVTLDINENKNGVLWSQTRMRIEMRLRCFLVISNLQLAIWQFVIGYL